MSVDPIYDRYPDPGSKIPTQVRNSQMPLASGMSPSVP
jgi:hypothetical protein